MVVNIVGTLFKGNSAQFAGAIMFLDVHQNITFDANVFEFNAARGFGGAVLGLAFMKNFTVSNCVFRNHSVGSLGGAVYVGFGSDNFRISGTGLSYLIAP